ncbi:MAG: NAD(P)(+) transhydrogenase (Re/Si-specific) subunit beta, partial [Pseudomonadota bacterium]
MANFTSLLYIAAGVLFILALRGLSSPETSRDGNRFGMIGMAIAILTTFILLEDKGFGTWLLIALAIVPGALIGSTIARKVAMTEMPQLVAVFHSLVGLAAVCIAWAAFLAPRAFNIGDPGHIHGQAILEMSLGAAIGAITFSGSVIAALKLSGKMSGKPIMLPFRHVINIALGVVSALLVIMMMSGDQSWHVFL